jgi:hypothetical protein
MGGKNRDLIYKGIIVKRLVFGVFFVLFVVAAGIIVFIHSTIDSDWQSTVLQPQPEECILSSFSFESPEELDQWKDKTLARKKTDYTVDIEGGKKCVKAVSEDSASTLYYRMRFSPVKDPYVSWKWKVLEFPTRQQKETLSDKAEFDFAAQVYVVFHANFFLNAKAIQYVWTENLPVGEVSDNPYTKNVKLLVLESGLSDEWKHEYRNIKEDFKRLFAEELKADIEGISFMTDADSTGTTAMACFTDFEIGVLSTGETKGALEYRGNRGQARRWLEKFPFLNKLMKKCSRLVEKGKTLFFEMIKREDSH